MWISDKVLKIESKDRGIDCSLESLGKINVFCGKNNSGKTTLLKQVQHQVSIEWLTYCINTVKLTSQEEFLKLDEDAQYWTAQYGEEIKTTVPLANEYIQRNRQNISPPLDIKKLFKSIQQHYSYDYRYVDDDEFDIIPLNQEDIPHFDYLLARLNYKPSNTALIEAKRNVVPDYDLKSENSKGLLKYLFECKNCLSSDPKRQWYDDLNHKFKELSGGYAFDLIMDKKLVSLFFEDAYDGSWYIADAMGLGLRDLLHIMAIASFPDTKVILLEEPESHLHPELQRRLLSFFSEQEDKLFFITTHSNVFLDLSYVDSLYLVKRTETGIEVENVKEKALIMSELGYLSSDNMYADILVITEGKTDIPIIEEFFKKSSSHPCYSTHDIKFIHGGGITNMPDINYNALIGNYNQIVLLVDGDESSVKHRVKLKEIVSNNESMHLVELDGYGIENYFTKAAIDAILAEHPRLFGAKFSSSIIDLKTKIEFNKDESLFRKIAQKMVLEDIINTDLYFKLIIYVFNLCKLLPETKQK